MERKISRSLWLMGAISAFLAVLISFYGFHSTTLDEQKASVLEQADVIVHALSYMEEHAQDDMEEIDYGPLSGFCLPNARVNLYSRYGECLYSNRPYAKFESDVTGQRVFGYADVRDALYQGIGGEGFWRHAPLFSRYIENHYTLILENRRILRLSVQEPGFWPNFGAMFPAVFLSFAIVFGISLLFSFLLTKILVKPINIITENLWQPETLFSRPEMYKELVPMIQELQMQRRKNDRSRFALTEEKDKMSAVLQDMTEGLIFFDRARRVSVANDSAQRYLKLSLSASDRPLQDARLSELKKSVDASMRGKRSSGILRIDGRQLQFFTDPIYLNKRHNGVLCFLLDVTEKLEIDEMKQDITASVSHEMKTPLTSIMGYAEMMETGLASKPEDIRNFSGVIHREADRLLHMIQDILRLSELESMERDSTVFEPVDLYRLAEESMDLLSLSAGKRKITMHLEGESHEVMGEREQLFELVYNLADNAIRYNNDGGEVWLRVEKDRLTVADSGIGIPEEARGRIFERFYRVDKSRSKKSGGTGLGLAIVKHIAQHHGAQIAVTAREGGGTMFTVDFPQKRV